MKRNTRTKILVAGLSLFNEHGEPDTTTNEIADEADISPGNLHYHFRRKSDLIDAILAEFQADAKRLLQVAVDERETLHDFWLFLHLLTETTTAYRFLFRDMEALVTRYPQIQAPLRHFARGIRASFELHLAALVRGNILKIDAADIGIVSRNLVVISLMTERFYALVRQRDAAEDSALRVARSVLSMLKPFARDEASHLIDEIAAPYAR
jgi:AcrR family transcriptional regulator